MLRPITITLIFLAAGCAGGGRTVRIPESAIQNPRRADASKKRPAEAYVIMVNDGTRTWRLELPVSQIGTGSFVADIPINPEDPLLADPNVPKSSAETQADRDMRPKADGEPPSQSYLTTLAKVNALFRKRQYELALIELVKLEQSYPDDERLLEMKGTLYLRLRKPKLAREAWERALAINPENTSVAQALESLLAE